MTPAYLRMPTVHGETVVFVSEDDLWEVPLAGGRARRLTSGRGEHTHPRFSPDGAHLAVCSHDEGTPDVWVLPAAGGEARRLTWLGQGCRPVDWSPDSRTVRFITSANQPSTHLTCAHAVPLSGGEPVALGLGHLVGLAERSDGVRALARHGDDLARWKRYRGGRTAVIWVEVDGAWRRLSLGGAQTSPLWHGERLVFVGDQDGVAKVYSVAADGTGLVQHSHQDTWFARHPSLHGSTLVYEAGARLWHVDLDTGVERELEVDLASPRAQRSRRFVPTGQALEGFDLHPENHSVALTARGRTWALGLWEGPVLRPGTPHGVRYRLARYLSDGERLLVVSDAGGEEALEVHDLAGAGSVRRLAATETCGRALDLEVSHDDGWAAFSNHRQELVVVDLASGEARVLDHSPHGRLAGLAFSPDGRWLAYALPETQHTCSIKLVELETGAVTLATHPEFRDVRPVWDPGGRYLYFLSAREYDPVADNLAFHYAFARGVRICLLTLRADVPSPLHPAPRALKKKKNGDEDGASKVSELAIDLQGLPDRVVQLPIAASNYSDLTVSGDRVLYLVHPLKGVRHRSWRDTRVPAEATLKAYDVRELAEKTLLSGVSGLRSSRDRRFLLLQISRRLRVVRATVDKVDKGSTAPSRATGFVDLGRVPVEVDPPAEWTQMLRESWRLMRDHFWVEDMSGVDWEACWERYAPLLDRVGCRSEWSDLAWQLQGELGTSHAYELLGDHRRPPAWAAGRLGATWGTDGRITSIARGDSWDRRHRSPLARPGLDVQVGDRVVAVDGQPLDGRPVAEALVNRAGREVQLSLSREGETEVRRVSVKTLRIDAGAWYRTWVKDNRARVHTATEGRAGYVHVPDMGPNGFSEFHRSWVTELDRAGLVIDIRYNRGGHVSTLLMDKLSRRVLGWGVQRWGSPRPYPRHAHRGPLVCITNQFAGSDGDIFGQAFKLAGLGPLIGVRSWGGVIGIWPRHKLADGTITTQPEFAGWYAEVGWGLENHGTEPDVVVEQTPADWAAGRDPQLDRAIELLEAIREEQGPRPPDLGPRPDLGWPRSGS